MTEPQAPVVPEATANEPVVKPSAAAKKPAPEKKPAAEKKVASVKKAAAVKPADAKKVAAAKEPAAKKPAAAAKPAKKAAASPRARAGAPAPVAPVPKTPLPRLVKHTARTSTPAGDTRSPVPVAAAHDSEPLSVVIEPEPVIAEPIAPPSIAEPVAPPPVAERAPQIDVAVAPAAAEPDAPEPDVPEPDVPGTAEPADPIAPPVPSTLTVAHAAEPASPIVSVVDEPATVIVREGVEFEVVADAGIASRAEASAVVAGADRASTRAAATGDRGQDESLSILMIASEAVPFAKTGGLADVAGALPVALGHIGHRVTIVLPRYRGVAVAGPPLLTRVVQIGQERHTIKIYEETLGPHARAWLVDEPALFDREGLYGTNHHDHPDNPRRFALLTRAALEGARAAGFTPDVVHAHDWQGGLAPVYLRTRFAQDAVLGGVPSVFTIHNIAYQGTADPSWLQALDLGWDLFRPEGLEYWHQISLLKAGIVYSDKITTVSPRYAQEILTPEFAFGLEGVLRSRRADLVGILNGIDADTWNPATDPFIPAPYSADDLSGKRAAKRQLLQAYGLPSDDEAVRRPLIGMVSRMVGQKGLDLIEQIAGELPHLGARVVVLGTGEPRYEEMWRVLTASYPDRIAAKVGFDEPLSHLVEAGSDLFLMPSHFEPCGLNQMYSLRYGTLPLVRATGGLDDTVENYDPYQETGNGFKFWDATGPALLETLRWALRVYDAPHVWRRLQSVGMRTDFSWDKSAREYAALYRELVPVNRVTATS